MNSHGEWWRVRWVRTCYHQTKASLEVRAMLDRIVSESVCLWAHIYVLVTHNRAQE